MALDGFVTRREGAGTGYILFNILDSIAFGMADYYFILGIVFNNEPIFSSNTRFLISMTTGFPCLLS
jgi:hypothetical protein